MRDFVCSFPKTELFVFMSDKSHAHQEEFSALLYHMRQAMCGGQVFIQVSLVWFSQSVLSVHDPVIRKTHAKG